MRRVWRFIKISALWIILIPPGLEWTGTFLNQACMIANGGVMPGLVNDNRVADYDVDHRHQLMTKSTHLKVLADLFDYTGQGVISIGDILINIGEWMDSFAMITWLSIILGRFWLLAKNGVREAQ